MKFYVIIDAVDPAARNKRVQRLLTYAAHSGSVASKARHKANSVPDKPWTGASYSGSKASRIRNKAYKLYARKTKAHQIAQKVTGKIDGNHGRSSMKNRKSAVKWLVANRMNKRTLSHTSADAPNLRKSDRAGARASNKWLHKFRARKVRATK